MRLKALLALGTLFALNASAQLKVDSLGQTTTQQLTSTRIFVEDNAPDLNLGAGGPIMNSTLTAQPTSSPIMTSGNREALSVLTQRLTPFTVGVKSMSSSTYSNSRSIGVIGTGQGQWQSIGVCGGVNGNYGTLRAGVYGSSSNSLPTITGTYAGLFNGDVRATGVFRGTLVSPTASASSGASELYAKSSSMTSSVTDNLLQVELLQMERMNQDGSLAANVPESSDTGSRMLARSSEGPTQTVLSATSYGLAADQLRQVYPELVYEDEEGNYGINYVEMVPLLVQSVKELSARIATLEKELGVAESQVKRLAKEQTTGIEETEGMDVVYMSQNRPNPFKESSVIGLNIPQDIKSAVINVYDLNGKQVQHFVVNERGTTNITVHAAKLRTGMYTYSLLVDGKVNTTRRMMVTE